MAFPDSAGGFICPSGRWRESPLESSDFPLPSALGNGWLEKPSGNRSPAPFSACLPGEVRDIGPLAFIDTKAVFKSLPMKGDEEVALSLVVEATQDVALRVGEIIVTQSVDTGVVGGVILRIGRLAVADPLDNPSNGSN